MYLLCTQKLPLLPLLSSDRTHPAVVSWARSLGSDLNIATRARAYLVKPPAWVAEVGSLLVLSSRCWPSSSVTKNGT